VISLGALYQSPTSHYLEGDMTVIDIGHAGRKLIVNLMPDIARHGEDVWRRSQGATRRGSHRGTLTMAFQRSDRERSGRTLRRY